MGPVRVISKKTLIGLNQLEKLEAAKTAYLWLPFLTFSYLSLPILTVPYCALLGVTGRYWALLGLTGRY